MNIVQRLNNLKKLKAEIRNIELNVEELREAENIGLHSNGLSEKVGPTYKFNSVTENEAIDIINKVEELENLKRVKEREIERLENALNILGDIEKEIIQTRHIDNRRWDTVTYKLDRSYTTCKSIEVQAIKKLEEFLVL